MNYTYIPAHPFPSSSTSRDRPSQHPTIIMTSNPSSKKTLNLVRNPKVSLLVHDWVSSRPPNVSATDRDRSPPGLGGRSSSGLASMLMQMNSAAVSSISATINGEAEILEPGTEEERWCRQQHLANNTFAEGAAQSLSSQLLGTSPGGGEEDGGRESYIEGEDVRVVVVRIKDGRISDWKGGVKDWVVAEDRGDVTQIGDDRIGRLVNGV
nr:pyridoxamine 5'-phosphate oxidase like [Quercus suber]